MHPSLKTDDEIAVYKKLALAMDTKTMYEFGYTMGKADMALEGKALLEKMVN